MRNNSPTPAGQRLQRLEAGAREAGVKLTHQRLEIFRALAAAEDPPDADAHCRAVRRRVPTVSVDTVYRTLWLLQALGLVTTLGPDRGGARFDANLAPHHHYVCQRCGLVRDFESAALDALRVPETVRALGSVAGAHVEVRGVCAACRAGQRSARPPSPITRSRSAP
jgi:Fur family peroxide stress response transcriptional regulator